MAKNPFSGSIDVSSLINIMQEVANGTKTVKSAEEELQAAYKKTVNEVKKLEKAQKELNDTRNINAQLKEMKESLTQIQEALKKVGTNSTGTTKGFKTMDEALKSINVSLDGFKQKSSYISSTGNKVTQYTNGMNQLVTVTQKGAGATATYSAKVKTLNTQVQQSTKHIKNAAFATENWSYNWAKAMQSFLTYNTLTQLFNTIMNGIHDMIDEVKNLDDALVELQKVTDLEGESLERFVADAFEAGRTVAKTGTEMVEAATAFAKAGYKDNALELGTVAAMYTNIADEAIDAADAADMIIAQMKAFNITAEDSIHIIDAINEVSNNFAVSSADISRNLGKASAVMANAGNSMEQYIGLMTAATEITRNASKAANGLKTITLRLQGMNDEGERDLEIQAQMEGLFNKLGISVYDANGELKNTYDILETLAPVYEKLSNAEKAYVTETIAGKYQAQNAAAILNNWKTAVDATATAMDSQGSAARENEKVLDSIQGHLQSLKSAWVELSNAIFDSDLLKFIVDLGTHFLEFANSGAGKFIIQTTAMIAVLGMLRSSYDQIKTRINNFSVGLSKNSAAIVVNTLKLKTEDKTLKKTIQKILTSKGAYDKETKSISKNALAEVQNALSKAGVDKAEKKKIMSQLTSKTVTESLTAATIAQTIAQEALNAALTFGISALVSGAITLFKKLADAEEETSKALAETEDEIERRESAVDKGTELNEKNKSLDEYINKYRTLHNELIDENTGYTRSVELRTQILDLQQDINDLLGDENGGIDLINDSLEEVIEKQNKIKKQAADDYMAEHSAAIDKAKKNLDENYYSGKRNKVMSYEWNVGGNNIGDDRWESMVEALVNSMNFSGGYSYGWGGKNKNRHGFDKEYYFDLDDINAMKPEEVLEMWKNSAEDLKKNKKKYLDEYGLSEDDYTYILETSNKNYKEIKDYIDKQNDVLNAAAESMVYSDDTYYKKITELQVAQAEYNKAVAEGDQDGIEKALEKITTLQNYVDNNIKDDTVKNYFQNILNQWQSDINKNNIKDSLKNLSSDIKNSLLANGINGDNFKDLLNQYQKGLTEGLDQNTITLLSTLNTLLNNGGYELEEFTNWLEQLGIIGKGTNTTFQETKGIIGDLGNQIDTVATKYDILTGAVDEFNDNGYISAKTFQSLVDKDLLNYLEWTKNGLQANTQELLNEADALKINALASLQESYAKDVLAIANDDLSAGTPYLSQALSDEKESLKGLGDLAKAQTGGLFDLAKAQAAVQAAGGNLDVDKYGEKLNKLNNYYNNLAQSIANINLGEKPSGTYKGKSSGSGNSKSSKEWWEEELEKLKDQYDNNEITINEYINSLTNLLSKVGQGTEAWRKINKELQKQKLDKIKDDYNAGRISLNQYIISLQNLQKEYQQSTKEWNSLAEAIKKAKLDQLKEQQNDLKSALSAVNQALDKQIDEYQDLKEAADERYNDELDKLGELQDSLNDKNDDYQRAQKAVVDFLNEQLDAINEQKDTVENYYDNVINAIEKMNEDTQESIELAEAYEALMNAMTQKTKKVYKEGLGWIWTTDAEAIKEAKKTYEDLITSATTKEIEEQKDKTVKSLEEQIESLQNYIDSWDKVFDKFDNEKNRNLADILLGENWTEMVSNLDPQIVEDFTDAYYDLQKNLDETSKQIDELNKKKEEEDEYWDKLIKDLQDYKGEWSDIANVYEEAQNALKAKQIMGANWEKEILDRRLDVLENFKNKYNAILAEIDKVDNMSTDEASGYTALRLPGYANGGEVDYTGLAVLHGTPNKPEYVLNNSQMRNLLGNLTKPRVTSVVNNKGGAVVNNYSFGDIELPNVTNAQQFANELKSMLNITKNQ